MRDLRGAGCRLLGLIYIHSGTIWKVRPKRVIVPYTKCMYKVCLRLPSTAGHEESCGNQGGPPSKAKYSAPTDSELVP